MNAAAIGPEAVEEPVTVVVRRTVRAGREGEFEEGLSAVSKIAHRYPGHLGMSVLHDPGSREYTAVFRFDNVANLARWEESAERATWIARADALCEPDKTVVQKLTGMEAWFALSGRTVRPPPRYKMAVVTWLAVFPIVQLAQTFVVPNLTTLPPIVRGLIVSVGMILLMTYIVMPNLTKIFARWLYPR